MIAAICRHGSARRTPQGTTENGAVTPADLVADCRTCSTTQGATDCRINSRIVRIRLNG